MVRRKRWIGLLASVLLLSGALLPGCFLWGKATSTADKVAQAETLASITIHGIDGDFGAIAEDVAQHFGVQVEWQVVETGVAVVKIAGAYMDVVRAENGACFAYPPPAATVTTP
jgi:hypothetical protein